MQPVLIAIELVVSIALIVTVLLQRSEGGALGMGGGGAGLGGLFTPRGAADTLTRTTAILAVLFFATSLALTIVALRSKPTSILDSAAPGQVRTLQLPKQQPQPAKQQAPAVPIPHG
jgi:preprotein translocase subunit SecG